MYDLPDKLYTVESIAQLENIAIDQYGIAADELMQRAGDAVFNVIKLNFSRTKKLLVLCGSGNNAGDGYVVARLARQAGYDVRVVSLGDPASLKHAAQHAYQAWITSVEKSLGHDVMAKDDLSVIDDAEIIVDALLGTGVTRNVSAPWSIWIDAVNQSSTPVVSVDIPSGLIADTGAIAGSAVQADFTVCFIGLKQGMFTAQGKDFCGEIIFDNLGLSDEIYTYRKNDATLINKINYALLPKRKPSSHKGCFGHVLIVGGNVGMPGAVILAARAALGAGAGLVSIITIAENIAAISSAVPEAMLRGCDTGAIDALFNQPFVRGVTHVAVGMGLGQDAWSEKILRQCIRLNTPLLIDADGLNLLSKLDVTITSALIITPHPGEAGRLLQGELSNHAPNDSAKVSSATIQHDRFDAIKKLHGLFTQSDDCTVVLKGSGTLIFDGQSTKVCNRGTPAMAAPGMGDVLSGIIVALMAQTYRDTRISLSEIAELGVCLHAMAAERCVGDKTRGLLASDVVDKLVEVLR